MLVVVVAGWGTACLHDRPPSLEATEALRQVADSAAQGDLVYEGEVHPRGTRGPPLFRYERRVEELGEGRRSSHVTRTPAGDFVVLHQADHTANYDLLGFREVHAQTGLVGEVEVATDGTATYRTTVDGRTRSRVEPPGDPLQVGPTLFGHVVQNWDSLVAGNTHALRFVVLRKRRSYRFTLSKVDGPAGTTTFEMVPTHPLVALAVPTTLLVFDEERNILLYTGRVPPLEEVGRRLEPVDATVTYQHVSERYR